MKKLLLSVIAICFTFMGLTANYAELFTYNKEKINSVLADLTELEEYLSNHRGVELKSLSGNYSALAENLTCTFNPANDTPGGNSPVFGIPSFCWGFCFNVPGIILVHVITNDYNESKKAYNGCLTIVILYAVAYILYIILLASFNVTYY